MSISFLEETLKLASEELLKRFNQSLKVDLKSDHSIVTDADLASEKVIIDRIRKYYPEDKIFSEEMGMSDQRKENDLYWIIDPLDGTTNYSRSYPFFCVSIARARVGKDGRFISELGGVINPISSKIYTAEKNKGAFCNGKAIKVSKEKEFHRSYLCTGFYYNRGEELSDDIDKFSRVAHVCQAIRRDGAAALDLSLVAEGIFDGFWEKGLKPWDIAAGYLLIEEAGGVVRNYTKDNNKGFNIEEVGIITGRKDVVDNLAELVLE